MVLARWLLPGQYLSVPGSIGFIALFGIAVLNGGVVMVNAINQQYEGGAVLKIAVLKGALSRLRPVLMTAATSALGLIPMLLATGIGSEVQKTISHRGDWRPYFLYFADIICIAGTV